MSGVKCRGVKCRRVKCRTSTTKHPLQVTSLLVNPTQRNAFFARYGYLFFIQMLHICTESLLLLFNLKHYGLIFIHDDAIE